MSETNTYDRLMRAWENSKELVRDFEMYGMQGDDPEIQKVFKEFAHDEGEHAAKLNKMLSQYREQLKSYTDS